MTKDIKRLVMTKLQRGFDLVVADFLAIHPTFGNLEAECLARDLIAYAEEAANESLKRVVVDLKIEESVNNPKVAK